MSTPPRILAVEDNEETQLLLEHLLSESYELVVVGRVEAALDAVEDHAFDILLLDINLSREYSGTDLLHHLRTEKGLSDEPAIALTAYAMPGDQEDFLESGFDGYISKPFTRDDLIGTIDEVLDQD